MFVLFLKSFLNAGRDSYGSRLCVFPLRLGLPDVFEKNEAAYDWCYIAALIINNVRSPDLFAQYGGI